MLTYSMGDRGNESLYVHLYRCIRRDIESGVIAADQRLPSKRALAEHLGVSVITVEGAYGQLQAEGYIEARPRRGYYASALAPCGVKARACWTAQPELEQPGVSGGSTFVDCTGATPGRGVFPYTLWAKVVREVLTSESEDALLRETSSAGSPRLRAAIASYLRDSRGMEVDPACIVVGAGAQVLYNVVVQLLGRHQRYAVENPGYPRLTAIYRANDVDLVHVPLDAQGMSIDALASSGARVAHIMPSHQYPTGIVTPVGRRYELLAWASEKDARYIIEDDYDCEFRLAGRPIPSLQSIDACDRVIYANTFAKSLGAAFRLGYLVLPAPLMRLCSEKLGFYSCTVSVIEQLALARFIEEGHYERHVGRARTRYRKTRDALIAALRGSSFGDRLSIEGADGGLHFLMEIGGCGCGDVAVARRARREGVLLAPLSTYGEGMDMGREDPDRCRFVMSYSGIEQESIPQLITGLERALDY